MILPDSAPERTDLVVRFRPDVPERAQASHEFRAAFAGTPGLGAAGPQLFALTTRAGVCGRAVPETPS